MAKHCEVCNLDFHDDYAYQGHLKGKKHSRNFKINECNKGIARLSVFVTLRSGQFSRDDLLNHLSTFGKIQKCKFGPHFNYCIIQFHDRYD